MAAFAEGLGRPDNIGITAKKMARSYYEKKQVLIIEDLAEMRSQLKSMLERLGIRRIDTTLNGEEAIEALKSKNYDIVFSDYELGRGKDGQQVLEEARHAKLLKEVSCFILVTAAQTVEMVMGALEYNPDGYITKPVTYEDLSARVERILKTKLIFEPINQAIDDGDLTEALDQCDELIKERPKIALPVLRIKGRIYLHEHNLEKAEQTFKSALSIREVAWANLGIAKVRYEQENYEESIEILETLRNKKEKYVESQDWLAKIYEAQGDLEKAQKTLEKAIAESPKAILRQSELARVARLNNDWAVATQAARKTVSLSRNSCHKNPEQYINLVEALQTQIAPSGLRDRRYISTEIMKTLNAIRTEYPDDLSLMVHTYTLDSNTQQKLGKASDAKKLALEARRLIQSAPAEVAIASHVVKSAGECLAETCDKQTLMDFIESKAGQNYLSDEGRESLLQKARSAEENRIQEYIDSLNNQGVEFFEKGKLHNAIEMFDQAADQAAASFSVLLNAVQAHIALLQKEGPNEHNQKHCEAHLKRLSNMPKDDRRYARYAKLSEMFHACLSQKK